MLNIILVYWIEITLALCDSILPTHRHWEQYFSQEICATVFRDQIESEYGESQFISIAMSAQYLICLSIYFTCLSKKAMT